MNARMTGEIPVLVISGSCGAGKTAVGAAVHELLTESGVSNAFLDLDALTDFWPPAGEFNRTLSKELLCALWPVYRKFGVQRMVLAGVMEQDVDVDACRVDGAALTVIRLTANEATRQARLRARETGESLEWHLARTVELEKILETAALEDYLVDSDGLPVTAVAARVLSLWLDGPGMNEDG